MPVTLKQDEHMSVCEIIGSRVLSGWLFAFASHVCVLVVSLGTCVASKCMLLGV